MTVRDSIYIDAPVQKVFDFVDEPATMSRVGGQMARTAMQDYHRTEEGVGTQFSWKTKVLGLPLEGFDVVTEYVPGRRIVDRSSRSLVGTWTESFEPEGSGTRVTFERKAGPLWRAPVLRLLPDSYLQRNITTTLQHLKAELESAPDKSTTA